jgi:kynurenine formamidase
MHLIDVSHTIEDGMITYKGLPAPLICDFLSHADSHRVYAEGTEFAINKIEMVGNTGTYIDAPYHRYPDGIDLANLALESVANLPGLVVRATARTDRAIDRDAFANLDLRGKAILVHTGWDAHWRTDAYFEGHPYLTEAAALYLRDSGVALVGIDSLNIDSTDGGHRPVHTICSARTSRSSNTSASCTTSPTPTSASSPRPSKSAVSAASPFAPSASSAAESSVVSSGLTVECSNV